MKRFLPLLLAIVVVASSFPGKLHAQFPSELSYEGETVAFVDLVGRPDVNGADLRPLLAQQAGQPYSQAKVQESIANLEKTGRFTKVEVKVTPQAEGLELDFVLQPAFYIGMIHFPDALQAFEYPRLFQVVNYPAQEPYDEKKISDGEQALRQFLRRSGYFLSTVHTEIKVDQANGLVDLIYQVNLDQKARFGMIEVKGPPPDDAANIARSLRSLRARFKGAYLKTGKSWDAERLASAVNFIRDYLSRRNTLAGRINLEPPRYDRDTNRADVTFYVEPGETVIIKAEGAKVSQRTLRRLIPVYEENAVDQDLIQEGERNLVSYFQGKGYFDAKVTTEQQEVPDDVTIIYHIETGHRHRVKELHIRGNQYFLDRELEPLVQVRRGGWVSRGKFSDDLVRRSAQALINHYRNAGFAQVEVKPEVVDLHPGISVVFNISEGPQSIVTDLKAEVNGRPVIETLSTGGMNLRSGNPFSPSLLYKDRDQIVAAYLDFGFHNVSFQSEIRHDPDPEHIAVTYRIEEGPQTDVSSVIELGRQQTSLSYLQLLAQIRAGKPLSRAKLLESESRLYNAGIFDWADVSPRQQITTQTQETVLVRVHEAQRNTITYGLGFEVSGRTANVPSGTVALPGLPTIGLPEEFTVTQQQFASPRGTFEYSRRNLRGRGETASVATLFARLNQRVAFNYAIPHFRSFNWSSLFSLSAERSSENPIFTARLGEGSLQFERPLDARRTKTVLVRYGLRRTTLTDLLIPDLVLPQDRAVRLSTLSASYIRDTRDRPLDARRGIFQTFDFALTPSALGSSADFMRLLGQTAYYRELRPWLVWANQGRLGLAKPFADSAVPLSERFYSGGSNSLRGFPVNAAGPQRTVPVCTSPADPSTCSNISVPVGGNMLFIINSEARFPIPIKKNLGGVFFYDGGNVYSRISLPNLWRDYSNTVGFGLRYDTPVGPVRFDVGRNLNPPRGIKATQYFVTLGQSF